MVLVTGPRKVGKPSDDQSTTTLCEVTYPHASSRTEIKSRNIVIVSFH
jgi:hypothetical protein